MKTPYRRTRLKTRVPVSTAEIPSPGLESRQRPEAQQTTVVGLNKGHEARLITALVSLYEWKLGADGNLYNPFPSQGQEERDAA